MLKYMLMVYTYLPFPGSRIVRLVVLRVYLIMHWGYQLCHSMCKGRSSKISKFLTFCSTILLIHHLLKICTTFEQWLIDVKSAVTLEQCLLVDKMNFKMLWSAFFHISNFSSAARGHFSIVEIFSSLDHSSKRHQTGFSSGKMSKKLLIFASYITSILMEVETFTKGTIAIE